MQPFATNEHSKKFLFCLVYWVQIWIKNIHSIKTYSKNKYTYDFWNTLYTNVCKSSVTHFVNVSLPCSRQVLQEYGSILRIPPNAKNAPVNWEFRCKVVPQQDNSYDCGPFVCYFCKCLMLKQEPISCDMAYFRAYMMRELLSRKVVPPFN